jgi:small subunit ribosomal protein S1
VVLVNREAVTVDIGYKSEGQISIREFTDRDGNVSISEGDLIDVYFDTEESEGGGIVLSRAKAEQLKVWRDVEEAFQSGGTIEGTIVGKVKGGLKVDVGVSAFLPGSHADVRPARNLDRFIGQQGQFAVLKFNRGRGNVVVSRRAVLEREREQLKEETLKVLEEGVIIEGVVKNITDYGAFVDLGGIDGLLHVTDMSWGRVNRPSDVLNVGDRVKVVVLKYDADRGRVSLGMKQIMPDPWTGVAERYPVGSKVHGKVVSLADYGAFVELEPGIEGLVHVSEMSWTKRISHPSKVVEIGTEVDVVVLDVDMANRRISLGLKQAEPNPWELIRINHPVGSRVQGVVKNITDFGVFVGVADGIDGLVHVSDLHWTKKVRHPSELYKKGDEVEAVVLAIDVENERLSLGVKQTTGDPWQSMQARYPVGARVKGKVTSVTDFGVFVELEEGVEGLSTCRS